MQHSKYSSIAKTRHATSLRYALIFIISWVIPFVTNAQTKPISLSFKNEPIKTVLAEIQQKSGYRVLYNDEVVKDELRVSVNAQNTSAQQALDIALEGTDLTYIVHPDELIVIADKKLVKTTSDVFGNVQDDTNETVPFANVLFFRDNDTTKAAYATVTDMKGNFQVLRAKHGEYQIIISFVGLETIRQHLIINKDMQLTFKMKTEPTQLQEVVVKGQEVRVSADKTNYMILKKDVEGAVSSLDLMSKIPTIFIDPVTKSVTSTTGGSVKILVNGANASEIDLKSLRPHNILRLEHYDIPPARYSEYSTVINVITKEREDGFAAGIDVSHAFTTGFGDDQIYAKYNKGKHQFSFDYSLNHRNYSDRQYGRVYDYTFKDVHYVRDQKGIDKFGYDDNKINLNYSNQDPDKYALQVRLSPNYMYYHADGEENVNYKADNEESTRTGTSKSRQHVFTPVADVYFWKQLPNAQELAINVVGTAFNTSNKYTNKEFDSQGTLVLNDDMNEQNRKYSLIAEANYSKKYDFGKLNFGYTFEGNRMNSVIENSFDDTDYSSSYVNNYAYGEFSGQKEKWMYMASIGLSNRLRHSYQQQLNDWVFRPRAMVGYTIDNRNSLRLVFERNNTEPALASLSNNKTYITDHIIRKGNPALRHSILNQIYAMYNHNSRYANLVVVPYYNYTQRPINSYFTENDDYIIRMSENGLHSINYGLQYAVTVKPFGSDILSIRGSGRVEQTEQRTSQIGNFSHLSTPFWYNIIFKYKELTVAYQGNIVGYSLSGPYLSTNENNAHLYASYAKDNWSVSAGWMWMGVPSRYRTKTIPESLVQYRSYTHIYDNKNMIIVGFSYNFNKGKRYDEKRKTLQNSDTDAGMF